MSAGHGLYVNDRPIACLCGWTADTLDGWDGLADWYGHVGILPPPEPAADAVEQFLRVTS